MSAVIDFTKHNRSVYASNPAFCVCGRWKNGSVATKTSHHSCCRFVTQPQVEGLTPEEAFEQLGPPG